MLGTAARLREAGVLGLNERNCDFIMRHNPRGLYPRVDDKVLTKELALKAGMAVPYCRYWIVRSRYVPPLRTS